MTSQTGSRASASRLQRLRDWWFRFMGCNQFGCGLPYRHDGPCEGSE